MIRSDKRIESIRLVGIGPFEDCAINFKPNKRKDLAEVHVFTGGNGCGKSTVLFGLASHFQLATAHNEKPLADIYDRSHTLDDSGLWLGWNGDSIRQFFSSYATEDAEGIALLRTKTDNALHTTAYSDFPLHMPSKGSIDLNKRTLRPNFYSLMPLAYSGQRPLEWPKGRGYEFTELTDSPTKNHLSFSSAIDPKNLVKWITNTKAKEALFLKNGNNQKAQNFHESLDVVTAIIREITEDDFEFVLEADTLEVQIKLGTSLLPFNVLPDGLKSIISWVADVLMRMDRLPWENKDTPVVQQPLILFLDEIDIHLHPKWQRKVLPVVQKLFPNAQIFVSTHSPFVVGSVEDAWVYKLDEAKENAVVEGVPSGAGTSYEVLMEEVFDVAEHYDVETQKMLTEMKQERDTLLRSPTASAEKFIAIAQRIANRSEELDGLVALELRQLAKHGRKILLNESASVR